MAEYEFPASHGQRRLWFMEQLVPRRALYHITTAIPLPFDLPPERFTEALSIVVGRHEVLRTSLLDRGGEPVQIVHDSVPVAVRRTDFPASLEELYRADADEPIALDAAPLWRARLVLVGDADWRLIFVAHHAILDATSEVLLRQELTEVCRSFVEGRAPRLPELPIQYADFAAWQREQSFDVDFWRRRLAGAPAVHALPTDRARPRQRSYRGDQVSFALPASIRDGVQRVARECGATPFMVLLAGYAALVARLSGQSDVVIGSPVSGRGLPELEPLIGMFINTVVHRVDVSGDPTFTELVGRVRLGVLEALEQRDAPFESLVEALAPVRDMSRSPLYQLGFNYLPGVGPEDSHGTAKLDLQLDLSDVDELLSGRFEYACDLFERATVEALAVRLRLLLGHCLDFPGTRISRAPIVDPVERARLLAHPPLPSSTPPSLVERILAAPGDAVAVVDPGGARLSYGELVSRARELAARLGAGPGPVGLLLPPGADAVVAVVACWLAGSAYLPLDPAYPRARIDFQLADAGARLLVTPASLVPLAGGGVDDDLAYVIYTSGSTGTPKGVGVTHANLAAYTESLVDLIGAGAGERWAMLQPLTFDFGVTMLAGALGTGGTLHLAARDQAADADWVASLVARHGIDHLKISPSHLAALRAARDVRDLLPRRTLILGGETSRWDDVAELRRHCRVVNHYGPTEATVGAIALGPTVTPAGPGDTTPIGRALPHMRAYILDGELEPVPDGVVGELFLGGAGVSRGYLGRPGPTAQRFLPNPFGEGRLYRTGDRARRLADGLIEFCGRVDDQAKVRGFRVEPGEVRHALLENPSVADAAVVVDRAGTPDARLVAYVVPTGLPAPSSTAPAMGAAAPFSGPATAPFSGAATAPRLGAAAGTAGTGATDAHVQQAAPPMGDAAPRVGDAAPRVGDAAGQREHVATSREHDAGPRVGDASPRVGDAGPRVGDAGPRVGDAGPRVGDAGPSVGDATGRAGAAVAGGGPEGAAAAGPAGRGSAVAAAVGVAELRDWLSARLPEHLVPSAFAVLDALPLAAHGKLDRSRLPAPVDDRSTVDFEPPLSGVEEVVASLYADLLRLDHVGRRDGFFALGGHSLLATRLVARLREAFDVELPLLAVFEAPTVAGLAARLADATTPALRPVTPVETGRPVPASYGQRRLWFLDQLDPGGPLYNTNVVLRLTGHPQESVLRRCVETVVSRHEVLRTTFAAIDDDVVQIVSPTVSVPWRSLEWPTDKNAVFAAETANGFDLAAGPLIRALYISREGEAELLLTLHHTVSDNSSAAVLLREVAALYRGEELAPLPVQYKDFAAWQRELVAGMRDTQLAYWRDRLAGLPPRLDLPTDRPRPAVAGIIGAHHTFDLPGELSDKLRALAAQEGATLFMALQAGFAALLGRYAGVDDVPIGVPYITRRRPELEPLIGFFVNTLVLRNDLSGEPTFRELLRRVRSGVLEAYHHSEVPFEALVEELAPRRDLSGSPLIQVLIMFDDSGDSVVELDDVTVRWETFAGQIARFDMSLFVWRRPDHLEVALQYRTDLFDRATIERFAAHLTELLTACAAEPDRPLRSLASAHTEVDAWNDTAVALPDSFALWDDPRVRRLARRLCERGVGADVVVGVCMERGVELLVAVHAILMAGGAYLPIEPSLPVARRELMARHAAFVLSDTAGAEADAATGVGGDGGGAAWAALGVADVADTDAGMDADAGDDDGPVQVVVPSEALAYVIFTSGSTGVPKGVGVSRGAIANRLHWMQSVFPLAPGERVLFKTPFSFDVSVWELLWPAMVGAVSVVAPPELHRDPEGLARFIEAERVTTVHFVPSMLEAFLDVEPPRGLKRVICSGEALGSALVERFFERLPDVELHNLYGPTEAAVDVSWHRCRRGEPTIPIGGPVANTRLEVLDAHMRRMPVGVPGELFLGGVQLARGYVGRPGLTAQRFVPDPFGGGGRLYRTGDVARWLPSGEVEYLGRTDRQVKVRGLRIELGEIEACLADLPGVKSAATAVHDGRIVGYVVADELPDWKGQLQRTLPEYMVPTAVQRLDALPVTANGKLDLAALPDVLERAAVHRPPGTDAELAVANAWCGVLSVRDVGLDDNFFDLGGDSIRCLKVIAALRRDGFQVELKQLVLYQTLGELAARLTRGADAARPVAATAFSLVSADDLAKLMNGGV